MVLHLFVDAAQDVKYYFSNGMILTTKADWEYQHIIDVDVPEGIKVVKIEIMARCSHEDVEMTLCPDADTKFVTSSAGWLCEKEMSFWDMINKK